MKKSIKLFFIAITIILLAVWCFKKQQQIKEEKRISIQLNQLRGVVKLVLWEQDFTLNNTESVSKKYFGLVETKESIHSTIKGRMGFHIDLADSLQTHFVRINDTIYIEAALHNTYIEFDLSTLNQIKESSLDPTLEIKKEEVIKNLQQKAIEEYIPTIKDQLSMRDIAYQEARLSAMTGTPVRIKITAFPSPASFNWDNSHRQ